MDLLAHPEQEWKTVNGLLLRQFVARSLVVLTLIALGLLLLTRGVHRPLDVVLGGSWMVINCAAIAWLGIKALRRRPAQPGLYVLTLIGVMGACLGSGAWLVLRYHPSLLWFTVGFTIPLIVFFLQLHQVRVKVGPHAR